MMILKSIKGLYLNVKEQIDKTTKNILNRFNKADPWNADVAKTIIEEEFNLAFAAVGEDERKNLYFGLSLKLHPDRADPILKQLKTKLDEINEKKDMPQTLLNNYKGVSTAKEFFPKPVSESPETLSFIKTILNSLEETSQRYIQPIAG